MSNGTVIFHVSEDYLAHHGIFGQKWGKRNGPPYPLGSQGESKSHRSAEEKRLAKDARNVRDAYNRYTTYEQIYEQASKTGVAKSVSESEKVLKAKKEYENSTKAVREYHNLSDDEWRKLRMTMATRYVKDNPNEFDPSKEEQWIKTLAYSDAFQNEDSAFGEYLRSKYNTTYKDYEKEFNAAQKKYKKVIEEEVKNIFKEFGDEVLREIDTYPSPIITTISDVQTNAILESLEGYDNLWLPDF